MKPYILFKDYAKRSTPREHKYVKETTVHVKQKLTMNKIFMDNFYNFQEVGQFN